MLGIDPGRAVLACAAMRAGRVVFAASAQLPSAAAATPILARWLDLAHPTTVVVERQNLRHGACAYIEGAVAGLAAGRGIACVAHVPREMHAACRGFGGYARNKRRAAAIVAALIPRDLALLRAAQHDPRRTDTADAALFVLWHTCRDAVRAVN